MVSSVSYFEARSRWLTTCQPLLWQVGRSGRMYGDVCSRSPKEDPKKDQRDMIYGSAGSTLIQTSLSSDSYSCSIMHTASSKPSHACAVSSTRANPTITTTPRLVPESPVTWQRFGLWPRASLKPTAVPLAEETSEICGLSPKTLVVILDPRVRRRQEQQRPRRQESIEPSPL